ncbi:MAG: 2-hydroxychromene-2-carboxylate isomerase [Pseudomonadota bacterium]
MTMRPKLAFWFEFASTYAYLTAMRIEAAANACGVDIVWRPMVLGPIFKGQGWDTTPFNIYPAKGRYMWRDIDRLAAAQGLPPVVRPDPFPQHSLLAARIAMAGIDASWLAAFVRGVFNAEYAEGRHISDPAEMASILEALGLDASALIKRAGTQETKDALRYATSEAADLGIFGAPSFVTEDGELFWGDDRLDAALAWAVKPGA